MKEPISPYVEDRYAEKNVFISMQPDMSELPDFEKDKGKLPEPVWAGHDDEIAAYYKAWEIAFRNLGKPTKESGFVSPYIDAAFNGHIFMWDSCFMLMFGKYGDSVHCFQKTLDNFYCKQHKDGFICREINELDGVDRFYRHDPTSTGPEIMAWCEWQYYKNYGDKERLKKVYYPLLSFHHWLKNYHRWKDGSYWSSGWGCGMDNLPRCDLELIPDSEDWMLETFHHSYMSWIDATLQAAMSCEYLIMMAEELGISDDVDALKDEYDNLVRFVNEKMWSEKDGFYYDLKADGSFLAVKTVAAFWALIAKIATPDRVDALCRHLEDKNEFNRPNRVPALSADHPDYKDNGGYWNGGVWAPTDYMILCGLSANGKEKLAKEIAECCYKNCIEVYKKTGTFWENYAPETASPGEPAREDFVGWTGIFPITVLIEYILGIRVSAEKSEIVWRVNRLEEHGIKKLPVGRDSYVTLMCEERKSENERPEITVESDKPIKVKVIYGEDWQLSFEI